ALKDGLKRFPTGTYALWYPQLARPEARRLPERLRALRGVEWLDASLSVRKAAPGEPGMSGSGLFIVNPPWTLAAALRECLPVLKSALAVADNAAFHLETAPEPRP
ncbi:MAG TPA: 23S rRNA (adenine(2030)-N(6))-methyltransferase RlmJ, partial [Thiobacillaceae bacterium]|nr:23S rRNA (adenine(2030)-N(6))-methyltransferase RlmJ [Thiobacillaceae bacterium]